MENIKIGRYQDPAMRKHWQGWIEPEDKSWIVFVRADGTPKVFLDREAETGAIIYERGAEGQPVSTYRPAESFLGSPNVVASG